MGALSSNFEFLLRKPISRIKPCCLLLFPSCIFSKYVSAACFFELQYIIVACFCELGMQLDFKFYSPLKIQLPIRSLGIQLHSL